MRNPQALLLLAPCLLMPCRAFNETNFALYKNTKLGACPPFAPSTAAPPVSVQSSDSNFTYMLAHLSPQQFCDHFWNYTVIATTPLDSAFSFTYASCLANSASFLLSSFLLYKSTFRRGRGGGGGQSPEHGMTAYYTLLKDGAPSLWTALAGAGPFFWLSVAYTSTTLALWWFSFAQLLRHHASGPRISLLAWITLYQYRIILHPILGRRHKWVGRVLLALAFAQLVATGLAVGLMLGAHPQLSAGAVPAARPATYALAPSPAAAPTPCTAAQLRAALLLADPGAPFQLFLYATAALIAALLFAPSVWRDLAGHAPSAALWVFQMYATAVVEGGFAGAMGLVAGRSIPVAWADACGAVHVAMSPDRGYWDVEGGRYWRIAKAWLNV